MCECPAPVSAAHKLHVLPVHLPDGLATGVVEALARRGRVKVGQVGIGSESKIVVWITCIVQFRLVNRSHHRIYHESLMHLRISGICYSLTYYLYKDHLVLE